MEERIGGSERGKEAGRSGGGSVEVLQRRREEQEQAKENLCVRMEGRGETVEDGRE